MDFKIQSAEVDALAGTAADALVVVLGGEALPKELDEALPTHFTAPTGTRLRWAAGGQGPPAAAVLWRCQICFEHSESGGCRRGLLQPLRNHLGHLYARRARLG